MKTIPTKNVINLPHRLSSLPSFCWSSLILGAAFLLSPSSLMAASVEALPKPMKISTGWELQEVGKVPEGGGDLSKPDYHPLGWYQATVPGTILTTLVNNKVYPEPLYGENNRPDKIPDSLCRTSYWYRAGFLVPADYSGRKIWLNFDGINYVAEVFVNGHQAGTIKGAFIRGIFDITTLVKTGAANAVAVHVFPQPHPGETHEKTIATGTGRNGGVTGRDGPTFLCTIGWDWIPTIRDRDTGIWQDVFLSASGPVVLRDPYVATKLPLPRVDSAEVTVQATVSNATETAQSGLLTGEIDGGIRFQQEVSLAPREARLVTFSPASTPALHLRKPRLWWPNGYGPQNLYKLHLTFVSGHQISDTAGVSFGVRQIEYSVAGSTNLTLSVNGVPVVAKGGDWGIDEAMKRIPHERLDAAVRMHQIANYTILRNWVGQSTSAELYDLCDRYGILLWDEFFEPHPLDGPIPDDVELYLTNVRDKILRFRNHPSIALWCARNEGDPPPAIGDGIKRLIDELDPIRLYQPSSTSGRGVNSGGPYHWRTPREFYTYSEAFKTEVGSISVPTLEAVKGMMPAKDWNTINDDWAEHDFCGGAQQGDLYPEILSSRYGYPQDLADFVRKAQLMNYECFRAMYEGRFAKLFRPETGVITWMSHPAQPSFVWQLYSHDLEPNASLYGTRKACEPVHVQLNQANWHLLVINNRPELLEDARVQVFIYNLDGTLKETRTVSVTAAASSATDAGELVFPRNLSPVHFVKLELRDRHNRLISENFYWRGDAAHEDQFEALNSLPVVTLDVSVRRHDSRGTCRLQVHVSNPSKAVALMAHFQLRRQHSGDRVLPVFYSDNYFSLLPGEQRSFSVESPESALNGDAPVLAVDGWNVTVAPTSKGVAVAPNTNAEIQGRHVLRHGVESINCGGPALGFFQFGTPAAGRFTGDYQFEGGQIALSKEPVNTGAPNAAPEAVYQSERWGHCVYRLNAPPETPCTVRLHFAELKAAPGERKFNVTINGKRVLTDFDIAAEAGKGKAVVKNFEGITADAQGRIVVQLQSGTAGEPKICGLQVLW